jgi:Mn2+/Fe2+ NRAMP family transporter
VITLAVRFVILDATARYVMATGKTLVAGFGRAGRGVIGLLFVVMLVRRHLSSLVKLTILGAAGHALLPLPTPYSTAIWGWASWVAGFALMFWGRYKAVERFSKPMAILLGGCLAAAALLSKPDVGSLLTGAFTPAIPESRGLYGPFLVIIAVMSAAAGSTGNLKYSAYVHERGWRDVSFLRTQRIDLLLSGCGIFAMLALIQIAAAGALRPQGILVGEIEDLIPMFSQVLGDGGRIVLAATLWSVVFTSYLGGTGLVLMMTDAYHRHLRPSEPDPSADQDEGSAHLPAFRWLTLYTFLSPLYVFMTDWNPIGLVLAQSASSVLGLPVIIFIILRLTSNRKVMGEHANGWLTNVILAAAALTTIYLSFEAGLEYLQGSR